MCNTYHVLDFFWIGIPGVVSLLPKGFMSKILETDYCRDRLNDSCYYYYYRFCINKL